MAGGAVFKLGSFGNFGVLKKGAVGHRSPFANPPSPRASEDRGITPVGGDDGNDRCFITRDFNRG